MKKNIHPADVAAFVAQVRPNALSGTVNSDWIDAGDFISFLAVGQMERTGTSGVLVMRVQQAQDGSGTGAKNLYVSPDYDAADEGSQYAFTTADMDVNGGFTHVRVQMERTAGSGTTGGGAALLGVPARVRPADRKPDGTAWMTAGPMSFERLG